MRTLVVSIAALIVSLSFLAEEGDAATIHLRSSASVSGAVVTLGDLARVSTNDETLVAEIESIELFPAPRGEKPRYFTVRDIQDALFRRGVDLSRHDFSGASRVTVSAVSNFDKRETSVSNSVRRSAVRKVADAIGDYLEETDGQYGWTVDVELTNAQAEIFAKSRHGFHVEGTKRPTTGTHRFELLVDGADGPRRVNVEAMLTKDPSIVVATRALTMGELISSGDVRLVPPGKLNARGAFESIEEVLGMELGRSVAEGRPLTRDAVIKPLLVRSGKIVSVCVRGGGIRVRTNGRAKQDGAQGDVITVENMANRAKYFARVVGHNEVEVCNILSRTR